MVSVVPHINTLIIDVGTECTKIGYAGDYHPFIKAETRSLGPPAVAKSSVVDIEGFIDIVEHHAARESVDSIIIIEHSTAEKCTRDRIAQRLIDRDVCGSFYFMKSAVCEVFGTGRVAGTVLSCSAGSTSISIVVEGEVVECHKVDNTDIAEGLQPLKEVLSSTDPAIVSGKMQEVKEMAFPRNEPVDISGIIGRKCEFTFKVDMEKYYHAIDRLMGMRDRHKLVKTMINGGILFTGGHFQNKTFFSLCKDYLTSTYGSNLGELVVGDGGLNLCFTGASIFGMNIESMLLFTANPKRGHSPNEAAA